MRHFHGVCRNKKMVVLKSLYLRCWKSSSCCFLLVCMFFQADPEQQLVELELALQEGRVEQLQMRAWEFFCTRTRAVALAK